MILGFKISFDDGKQTFFKQRILWGLGEKYVEAYYKDAWKTLLHSRDVCEPHKYHTIRRGYRWEPGMKIHFATGVRTKQYDNFAIAECTAVEEIFMTSFNGQLEMSIEGRYTDNWDELAKNDGFDSVQAFEKFFLNECLSTDDFMYRDKERFQQNPMNGNETGKYKYRPMLLDWARYIVRNAHLNNVACFVKQLGTYQAKLRNMSDKHGGDINEFQPTLQVREFPKPFRGRYHD